MCHCGASVGGRAGVKHNLYQFGFQVSLEDLLPYLLQEKEVCVCMRVKYSVESRGRCDHCGSKASHSCECETALTGPFALARLFCQQMITVVKTLYT